MHRRTEVNKVYNGQERRGPRSKQTEHQSCPLLDPDVNTPLNFLRPRASSSTHVRLDDMSQHPQQIVHYAPLALTAAEDDVPKQKGTYGVLDEDADDVGHSNYHQHRRRSSTNPRRSTSGRVSQSRSRRSGSLARVYNVEDECTGLITPNGMEVHLATVDQKRRKWWGDAVINLCFIASWYVPSPAVLMRMVAH
jgi:hypothetical protein